MPRLGSPPSLLASWPGQGLVHRAALRFSVAEDSRPRRLFLQRSGLESGSRRCCGLHSRRMFCRSFLRHRWKWQPASSPFSPLSSGQVLCGPHSVGAVQSAPLLRAAARAVFVEVHRKYAPQARWLPSRPVPAWLTVLFHINANKFIAPTASWLVHSPR